MLDRRIFRLFVAIAFSLFAMIFVACGSDKSSGLTPDDDPLADGTGSSGSRNSGDSSNSWNGSSSSAFDVVIPITEDTLIADTTSVSSVDELPPCSEEIDGETFMVEAEKTLYFCLEGSWIDYNTVTAVAEVTCGNGVLVVDYSRKTETLEESDSLVEPRRVGAHMVGIAEKGPFRYGTSIELVELDSAQHLADSKRTHEACVLDAEGHFSFDSVDLVSPYLRVKAVGYFRNELTGGLSAQPVTLEAVVDATEKDSVNVNMLTHMEAPRVLKLVENSGNNQPIRAVKAQALREILASFEINLGETSGNSDGGFGWNFGQQQTTDGRFAEDIGLFDGDEYSGALLAVSIMMQRKGSGSEMLSYTGDIAERIKGNGNWDDNNAKADLADWLMVLDTSGSYAMIRNNMAQWHLGDVPEFEKHLKHFWTTIYNFGECDALSAGTVKFVNNSLSAFFVSGYDQPGPKIRFICDANTHEWRAATDMEKDTVGFGEGEYEGQLKSGVINRDKYYLYEQGQWRAATADDIQEFVDVEEVYKSLGSGEKVIFFLRHAKRTDDTGKNGHLTDEGVSQAQNVGGKLKGEKIYFANSTYTRSKETCENIAKGAGTSYSENTLEDLDGEWYVKDSDKLNQYRNSGGGGWVVASAYAYKGGYTDAYYDLDTRSEEFISTVIAPQFKNVTRVGVFISHDMFIVPLTVYFTDKKVNLRYFETQQWINYLAGLAIIMGSDGKIRYVPVKGLEFGAMTM